jgi:hypothetical protein
MQDQHKAAFKFVENNEVSLACSALARNQTACAAGPQRLGSGQLKLQTLVNTNDQLTIAPDHHCITTNSVQPPLPAISYATSLSRIPARGYARGKQTYALKQFVSGTDTRQEPGVV